MPEFLRLNSLLLFFLLLPAGVLSQQVVFPSAGTQKTYNIVMRAEKGAVSGVCVLANDSDSIRGAVVNEFGLTLVAFVSSAGGSVRLLSVAAMLDRWYIRPVLESEIGGMLAALRDGHDTYTDSRRGITVSLSPADDAPEEQSDGSGDEPARVIM